MSNILEGEDNMCTDYVASESTRLGTKVIWQGAFAQKILEITVKDISGVQYERMEMLRFYFSQKKGLNPHYS